MCARYDVTSQKPSGLEQTFAEFFEPELAQWLLIEMEQNRKRKLAASKVIQTACTEQQILNVGTSLVDAPPPQP